jgi:hypothetical protein
LRQLAVDFVDAERRRVVIDSSWAEQDLCVDFTLDEVRKEDSPCNTSPYPCAYKVCVKKKKFETTN